MKKITLFISYSWKDSKIVEAIEEKLLSMNIEIIRDRISLKFRDNLEQFMKNIKYADFSLILFSNNYLTSQNCMYEAIELLKLDNYKEKIIPIILENTDIFNVDSCIEYASFWKEKYKKLSSKLSTLDPEQRNEDDLKVVTAIKNSVFDFLSDIRKINCLLLSKDNINTVVNDIQRSIRPSQESSKDYNSNTEGNGFSYNKLGVLVIGIGNESIMPLDYLENSEYQEISLISLITDMPVNRNFTRECYYEDSYGIIERNNLTKKIKEAEIIILIIDPSSTPSTINEIQKMAYSNSKAMTLNIIIEPYSVSKLTQRMNRNFIKSSKKRNYCVINTNDYYIYDDINFVREINKKISVNITNMIIALHNLVYKNNGIMNVTLSDIRETLKPTGKFIFICETYDISNIEDRLSADVMHARQLFHHIGYKFNNMLLNISGADDFSLVSMGAVSGIFREAASEEANIIVGTSINYSLNHGMIEVFAIMS